MTTGETQELQFDDRREIYTVAELNREARRVIETSFGTVWVEGEISNLARPSSGHMYWSLKDADAQVRCAMFRQYGRQLTFMPDNGRQVLVRGRVSIYEARGDFQILVDYMEEAGEGALRRRFEQLKNRLAAEGLFDAERKKALPTIPRRIGVVTSPTGAAIRDVLTALKRRFPAVEVLIYPSSVQGDGAAEELAAALRLADRRGECDLLILTRGGGSLEDLWAFNEEVLARAISEVTIPVISGVGHETDFTIADFVADLRAPTPSQAAELAVPDQSEWLSRLAQLLTLMGRSARRLLAAERQRLSHVSHRLERAHPGVAVRERAQRLDELEARLHRQVERQISAIRGSLDTLAVRVRSRSPLAEIALATQRCGRLGERMTGALRQTLERSAKRLDLLERGLRSLSPLATLERGYAIVTLADGATVATSVSQLKPGDGVGVRLARGKFDATVERIDTASGTEDRKA